MHSTTGRFWASFERLPKAVQRVAREKLRVVEGEPCASIVAFQEGRKVLVGKGRAKPRALAIEDGSDFIWVWIGPHDEYRRLIRQRG